VLNLIAAGAVVLAGTAVVIRAWVRSRITPQERERRRRAELIAGGKLGDATLLDLQDNLLLYSYEVRSVTYTAFQDVSGMEKLLPADTDAIFGPVLVKYDAKNPANSIVLSESWNGLRTTPSSR
jgi:hypothetical protein